MFLLVEQVLCVARLSQLLIMWLRRVTLCLFTDAETEKGSLATHRLVVVARPLFQHDGLQDQHPSPVSTLVRGWPAGSWSNPPGAFNWGGGLWGGRDLDQLYQAMQVSGRQAQPQGSGPFLSEKFRRKWLPGGNWERPAHMGLADPLAGFPPCVAHTVCGMPSKCLSSVFFLIRKKWVQ